jgi:cell division protein FtsN
MEPLPKAQVEEVVDAMEVDAPQQPTEQQQRQQQQEVKQEVKQEQEQEVQAEQEVKAEVGAHPTTTPPPGRCHGYSFKASVVYTLSSRRSTLGERR